MTHQVHVAQAIAEQRQAELVAAAQYPLVRPALRRGTTPLRSRGRRAARQLVGWFSRQHATT
jgi:hypothetical protein